LTSSSSGSYQGCLKGYCADGFQTAGIDGTYSYEGYTAGKPRYFNGTNHLFWDVTYSTWAISQDAGDPPNQWLSSQDVGDVCPDGTYTGEAGTVTEGECPVQ